MELAVHQRHLELVLEVRHGPEAAHHHPRPGLPREIHQQPVEGLDRHRGVAAERGPEEREPLVDAEERLLGGIEGDGHDQAVAEREAPPHQVLMAARGRVERSRIDRCAHQGAWRKVMAVSP
jgi:hypothetical protein